MSETLAGKAFFDVAVLQKLANVININRLEVVNLNMLCFVTFSCCHEDLLGGGHTLWHVVIGRVGAVAD